jgi:cell wall assembly regulator SMI1
MSKKRIIGTTIAAIQVAEAELGRTLPNSFANWLVLNNGKSLGSLTIFPVFDARDPRKTWDSIVRVFKGSWQEWLENFEDVPIDFSQLLPFAEFGTGDFYCFDYSKIGNMNEPIVALWSHETGETTKISESFSDFLQNTTW